MQTNQNMTYNIQPTVQPVQPTQAQTSYADARGLPNKPEKKFQAGSVSITVWKNSTVKDGKQVEYRTISVGRSYKKNGQWQNTTASVRVHDLPKLSVMIDEAYKYLILQPKQTEAEDEAIVM
jgi:hypothetical protein